MELKSNVSFPLAMSYDTRGTINAFNDMSARDQYKVNLFSIPVMNSFTGKVTLYLTKRPGASINDKFTVAGLLNGYHLGNKIGTDPNDLDTYIVTSNGISTRIAQGFSVSTIFNSISSNLYPTFHGGGFINSVDTRILQFQNLGAQRVFYATSFSQWIEIVGTFSTFWHVGKMEVMDGFGFQLVSTNRIYNSNINTISTWPDGNFISKQTIQDPAVGLAKFNNQILAFGFDTVEVFYNGGLSPAPLVRIPHLAANIGVQARWFANAQDATHYYSVVGNKLYFNSNAGGVYSYDGARFEKVSTPIIEGILLDRPPSSVDRIIVGKNDEAAAFRITDINSSTQRSLLFFPRNKEWVEWQSDIFKFMGTGAAMLGNSTHVATTFRFPGSTDWQDRNGGPTSAPFSSHIQFKWPAEGIRQQMNTFGVIGDTEVSTTTSQLQVEFSDDDGQSYRTVRTIDMTQMRKQLTRCGSFHQRTVRLTHVGNTEIRLEKIIANVK